MSDAGQTVFPDFSLIGYDGKGVTHSVAAIMDIGYVLTFHLDMDTRRRGFIQVKTSYPHEDQIKRYLKIYTVYVCICAQSNLSMSERSDGHPWDPAVLQVSVSWRNDNLVQEVHP